MLSPFRNIFQKSICDGSTAKYLVRGNGVLINVFTLVLVSNSDMKPQRTHLTGAHWGFRPPDIGLVIVNLKVVPPNDLANEGKLRFWS